jgi:hypothetical protein
MLKGTEVNQKAVFYIVYLDGKRTEVKFKTDAMAQKAYKMYNSEPEENAKCWGWEIRS